MSSFKVVIVGGGPVGLTAAHALSLAGIDFVLLEHRQHVVFDVGANLVLGPNSMRIMHQLGLFDALMASGSRFNHQKVFDISGRQLKDTYATLELFNHCHGTSPVLFYRADLIRILYEGLPKKAQTKVLTGKEVMDMTSGPEGVVVSCADGTSYAGSVVLGADGVRSKTRSLMHALAMQAGDSGAWDETYPFTASYRIMWFCFPPPSEPGEAFETQHKDHAVVYFTSRDRGFVLLTEKLPRTTKERAVYQAEDVAAIAERFADFPVNESLKVKDVFATRHTAGMCNIEEGRAKHWSWGRIVLAGDACHKMTPNSGLGFNNGIQDVVALCNRLHRTLQAAPSRDAETAILGDVFRQYQKERCKALRTHAFVSTNLVRANTWMNAPYYVLARYIMASKHLEHWLLKHIVCYFIRNGLVLDYVKVDEPFHAAVRWKHSLKSSPKVR